MEPPQPTEEDVASVLKELENLKNTQPDVFKQLLQSLGMATESELVVNGEDSIRKMTESISKMRSETQEGDVSGINLTGNKNKPKGITITPESGFSFKTVLITSNSTVESKEDKQKVFINFTQHEDIAAPGMKKKLNDEGVEVEGMNIPMSVGALHYNLDNKDQNCHVYDIIVNPIVILEANNDKTGKYRDFICQLGIQCIENKYKLVLDKRYKLPKLKYFGKEIQSQYIQDRKSMPTITEVSSSNSNSNNKSTAGNKNKSVTEKEKKNVMDLTEIELPVIMFWLIDSKNNNHSNSNSNNSNNSSTNTVISISPETLESLQKIPYAPSHSFNEYIDPVQTLPTNSTGLLVVAEVNTTIAMEFIQSIRNNTTSANNSNGSDSNSGIDVGGANSGHFVQTSPYKLVIKLPGYKKQIIYLPTTILPQHTYTKLQYPTDGRIHKVEVHIVLPIDSLDAANISSDVGSKPWLVAQALSSDGNENAAQSGHGGSGSNSSNPYAASNSAATGPATTTKSGGSTMADKLEDSGVFAEDKFHIKLPDDVDKYTGIKLDPAHNHGDLIEAMDGKVNLPSFPVEKDEEDALPEDRFHTKDASSSYLIQQREQAKQDKWDKFNKEKAERANDPNVEYVDMDDFRPGGKYENEQSKEARDLAALANSAENNNNNSSGSAGDGREMSVELKKAAEVVANSQDQPLSGLLSSSLWSELL